MNSFPKYIITFLIACLLIGCGNSDNTEIETVDSCESVTEDSSETDSDTAEAKTVNNEKELIEALNIKEYEYPSEFVLQENLEHLLENIAIYYNDFDSDYVLDEEHEDDFIWSFCQNSWFGFDYLYSAGDSNGGYITSEQLEYIQYSFSGKYIKFQTVNAGDKIDISNPSSGFTYAMLDSYEAEKNGEEILITAHFETRENAEEDAAIVLFKNPYSCFDGYSVKSFKVLSVTEPTYCGD